jgi:predicted dinucleotide-binding enzyme
LTFVNHISYLFSITRFLHYDNFATFNKVVMQIKQTVVIIGMGCTGQAIATRLAMGNFNLLLCDKELGKAEALVKELKGAARVCQVEAMPCLFESAWEADIIMLSMHFGAQKEVAGVIKEVVNQKIVISVVQPGAGTIADPADTAGQLTTLQELLPNTRIVGITHDDLNRCEPGNNKISMGVLLTGIDEMAVETVSAMLLSAGIRPRRVQHLSATRCGNMS